MGVDMRILLLLVLLPTLIYSASYVPLEDLNITNTTETITPLYFDIDEVLGLQDNRTLENKTVLSLNQTNTSLFETSLPGKKNDSYFLSINATNTSLFSLNTTFANTSFFNQTNNSINQTNATINLTNISIMNASSNMTANLTNISNVSVAYLQNETTLNDSPSNESFERLPIDTDSMNLTDTQTNVTTSMSSQNESIQQPLILRTDEDTYEARNESYVNPNVSRLVDPYNLTQRSLYDEINVSDTVLLDNRSIQVIRTIPVLHNDTFAKIKEYRSLLERRDSKIVLRLLEELLQRYVFTTTLYLSLDNQTIVMNVPFSAKPKITTIVNGFAFDKKYQFYLHNSIYCPTSKCLPGELYRLDKLQLNATPLITDKLIYLVNETVTVENGPFFVIYPNQSKAEFENQFVPQVSGRYRLFSKDELSSVTIRVIPSRVEDIVLKLGEHRREVKARILSEQELQPRGKISIAFDKPLEEIETITFDNVELSDDLSIPLAIDSLEDGVQSYAIDPSNMTFDSMQVTVRAKGNKLYKCTDWYYTNQTCFGEFTLFKDNLTPGELYTFNLTPQDPGFVEISTDSENTVFFPSGDLTTTLDISPVNLSSSFVMCKSTNTLNANLEPDVFSVTCRFVNETQIIFERYASSQDLEVSYQIVEADNIRVYSDSLSTSATAISDVLTAEVNLSQSFIIYSSRLNDGDRDDLDELFFNANFTDNQTVRFERFANTAAAQIEYFVVEFTDDTTVQTNTFSTNVASSTTSIGDTFSTAVQENRTWMVYSYAVDTNGLSRTSLSGELLNPTQVQFNKDTSTGGNINYIFTYHIIEFANQSESLVQHRVVSTTSNNDVRLTDSITPVDTSESVVYFGSATSTGSGNAYPRPMWNGFFTDGSQVEFNRGYFGQGAQINYQVVTWPQKIIGIIANKSAITFGANLPEQGPASRQVNISAIGNNQNVTFTCTGGNCSEFSVDWVNGNSLNDLDSSIVTFTCDNTSTGIFSAEFEITSNQQSDTTSLFATCEMLANNFIVWDVPLFEFGNVEFQLANASTILSLDAVQDQTGINVSCDGSCSQITQNWTNGQSVLDGQTASVNFTCDSSTLGQYSAVFSVVSNEDITPNNVTLTCDVADTTPPLAVIGVTNTSTEKTWVQLNWTNPAGVDKVIVDVNGTFFTNVSTQGVNITGLLPSSFYNFSLRTVDISDNINQSSVDISVQTVLNIPPVISIIAPLQGEPFAQPDRPLLEFSATDSDSENLCVSVFGNNGTVNNESVVYYNCSYAPGDSILYNFTHPPLQDDTNVEVLWLFDQRVEYNESSNFVYNFASGASQNHDRTCDTNCPTYTQGQFGNALSLDGSQYLLLNESFFNNAFSTRSYQFWVKPDVLSGIQYIYEEGGSTNGLALRLNDSTLEYATRVGGTQFTITSPFGFTNWTYVAVTYDSGNMSLYINGDRVDSLDTSASYTTISSHGNDGGLGGRFGSDAFGPGSTGDFMDGSFDTIRILTSLLSEQDIAAGYSMNGTYNWQVYVTDELEAAVEDRTFEIVDVLPFHNVSIIYPQNEQNYSQNLLDLNFTFENETSVQCFYGNGSFNSTPQQCQNYSSLSAIEGVNTWTMYINNSFNVLNTSSVTFTVDTIQPNVTILFPQASQYNVFGLDLNYTVTDSGLSSCWYSLDDGVTNSTQNPCANYSDLPASLGQNNWTIYAQDFAGNIGQDTVSFEIVNLPPSLTNISYSWSNGDIFFNNATVFPQVIVNFSDSTNLNQSFFETNGTGVFVNQTRQLNDSLTTQIVTYDLNLSNTSAFNQLGDVTLRSISATDAQGMLNRSIVNQQFSLWQYGAVEIEKDLEEVDDFGDSANFVCRVYDPNTANPIVGATVDVYTSADDLVGSYQTNTLGEVNFPLAVTQPLRVDCLIATQANVFMAVQPNSSNVSVNITAQLDPGLNVDITNLASPAGVGYNLFTDVDTLVSCEEINCGDVNVSLLQVDDSWWNLNYSFRKQLDITTGPNTPYNNYSGYTVRIEMNTTGPYFKDNGDDLRVLYNDSGTWVEIDRVLQSPNRTNTTVIFALADNVSASTTISDYWIYHGYNNASAPPAEPLNVYLWFDDGSADNQGDYRQGRVDSSAHGGAWNNGVSHNATGLFYNADTGDNFGDSLRPIGIFERDVYVEFEHFQFDAYPIDMTSGPITRLVIASGSGSSEEATQFYYYEMADSSFQGSSGYTTHDDISYNNRNQLATGLDNGLLGTYPGNTWTRLGLATWGINPTNANAYYNNESGGWGGYRFSGTHAAGSDSELPGEVGIWQQQDGARIDNILIRRYTEPEPVVSVSQNQSLESAYAITTTPSTPVYINQSNPKNVTDQSCLGTLLADQNCPVTFDLNATGVVETTMTVYAYAISTLGGTGISSPVILNVSDLTPPVYSNYQLSVSNGSVVYRNETLNVTVDWTDDWSLNNSVLYLNEGVMQSTILPLDGLSNSSVFTLNLSNASIWPNLGENRIAYVNATDDYGNVNQTPVSILGFDLYSYVSATPSAIPGSVAAFDTNVTFFCEVEDVFAQTGVAEYVVNISSNISGLIASVQTNASGIANTTINVTESMEVFCTVGDNQTSFFTAHPTLFNQSYTLISDTQAPTWSDWQFLYSQTNATIVNNTDILRNESVYVSALWQDNFILNDAFVEHNGSGTFTNYSVLFPNTLDANLSWANYTLNLADSAQFANVGPIVINTQYGQDLAPNTNKTESAFFFNLYGLIQPEITIQNANNIIATTIDIECRVFDTITTDGIVGYTVNFSSNQTGFISSAVTNSEGIATTSYLDDTDGQEIISCDIGDEISDYYVVEQNQSTTVIFLGTDVQVGAYNTFIQVWDTLSDTNSSNDELVMSDFILNTLISQDAQFGLFVPYSSLYNTSQYLIQVAITTGSDVVVSTAQKLQSVFVLDKQVSRSQTAQPELLLNNSFVIDDGAVTDDIFTALNTSANYRIDAEVGEMGTLVGDADIVVSSASSSADVAWYENNGTPESLWIGSTTIANTANIPSRIVASDFDNDGDVDIASIISIDDDIILVENTGSGASWATIDTLDADTTDEPLSIVSGDLDNDGYADLVVGMDFAGSQSLQVMGSDTTPFDGGWTTNIIGSDLVGNDREYRGLALADLDDDNDLDIVACGGDTDRLVIFRNDGTPFVGSWTSRVIATNAQDCTKVGVTDFDGDSFVDIAVSMNSSTKFRVYRNDLAVDGDVWNDIWGTSQSVYNSIETGHDLALADIDRDGDVDIVGSTANINGIYWFENDGTPFSGTWIAHTIDASPGSFTIQASGLKQGGVEVADINNDGLLDVVAGFGQQVSWYQAPQNPTSTWTEHTVASIGSDVYDIFVFDMDEDDQGTVLDYYADQSENLQSGVEEFSGINQLDNNTEYAFSFVIGPDSDFSFDQLTSAEFLLSGGDSQSRSFESVYSGEKPISVGFSMNINQLQNYSLNQSQAIPVVTNVSLNPAFGDGATTISCQVIRDGPNQSVSDYSVTFRNDTGGFIAIAQTNQTGWANISIDINQTGQFNYSCEIAENLSDFIQTIDNVQNISIEYMDGVNPIFENVSFDVPAQVTPEDVGYFNVTWQDNFGLQNATLQHNGTGEFVNYTIPLQSITNISSFILNFSNSTQFSTYGTIGFRIFANDSQGNTNVTPFQTTEFSRLVNHVFYGDVNSLIVLGRNQSVALKFDQAQAVNLYAIDSDATISWLNLEALGRTVDKNPSVNDFSEADIALNISGVASNIEQTYGVNSSIAKQTKSFTIYDQVVDNVPHVNSTNTSSFITAILWDTSDSVDLEYDGSEDLVFFTQINESQAGSFGTYDYEIAVPANLQALTGGSDQVAFYIELK